MRATLIKTKLVGALSFMLCFISLVYCLVNSINTTNTIILIQAFFTNDLFLYSFCFLITLNASEVFINFGYNPIKLRYKKRIHYFNEIGQIEALRLSIILLAFAIPWFVYTIISIESILYIVTACLNILLFILLINNLIKMMTIFIKSPQIGFLFGFITLVGYDLAVNPNIFTQATPISMMLFSVFNENLIENIIMILIQLILLVITTQLLSVLYVRFDSAGLKGL